MDVEARLDELFATPIDEFTSARNSLAKELAEQGDKDAAARVKALKKPTTTVWAINQLAHRHGPELEELVRIHERMAKVKGAEELRKAGAERRRVISRLTDLAKKALQESGRTATSTTNQRISQTLLAASGGEGLDALRWGRLTGELEGPGFGALSGFAAAADSAPYEKVDRRAQERVTRLNRAAEGAERDAAELARAAADAEREARRLAQKADRARQRAQDARRKADKAAEQV